MRHSSMVRPALVWLFVTLSSLPSLSAATLRFDLAGYSLGLPFGTPPAVASSSSSSSSTDTSVAKPSWQLDLLEIAIGGDEGRIAIGTRLLSMTIIHFDESTGSYTNLNFGHLFPVFLEFNLSEWDAGIRPYLRGELGFITPGEIGADWSSIYLDLSLGMDTAPRGAISGFSLKYGLRFAFADSYGASYVLVGYKIGNKLD